VVEVENLISTIVFVLPGFMLYFWVQMMGVNPVVKHTVAEFAALAALAWFPVIATSLWIMSLYDLGILNLDDLISESRNLRFIAEFLGISLIVSFILGVIYVRFLYPFQLWITNKVRVSIKKIPLSNSPSVWEEVFFKEVKVVGFAKFGSNKPDIVGNILNVARPFEPKRGFRLIYMDHVKLIIEKYDIPIVEIFTDVDAGVHVFIYDTEAYQIADEKEKKDPKYIQTPSRSSIS
jgi:hypothetical protein